MTGDRATTETAGVRSSIVELSGGRVFGYRLYGAADGRPVIALHGTPGSRYKFASSNDDARDLGLTVVSLDRWGYGLSSARPDGTLNDFAGDVVEMANRLGIGRFHVLGISGGGPFATAVAARYPERVVALALVAPVGPIAGVTPKPALSAFHVTCFRLLPRIPGVIPAAFAAFRAGLRLHPARTLAAVNLRSVADRQTLADPAIVAHLARTFREGLEPGVEGTRADMAIFSRAWDIDFARANVPARMWIGTLDRNVPLEAARGLAGRLPRCEVVEIGGAGHLWISRNAGEVLGWLAQHR